MFDNIINDSKDIVYECVCITGNILDLYTTYQKMNVNIKILLIAPNNVWTTKMEVDHSLCCTEFVLLLWDSFDLLLHSRPATQTLH